jgi:hypothetical protein
MGWSAATLLGDSPPGNETQGRLLPLRSGKTKRGGKTSKETSHGTTHDRIGGLIVSQALTLYATPVIYLYFDRLQNWWTRLWKPVRPIEPEALWRWERGDRRPRGLHWKILADLIRDSG